MTRISLGLCWATGYSAVQPRQDAKIQVGSRALVPRCPLFPIFLAWPRGRDIVSPVDCTSWRLQRGTAGGDAVRVLLRVPSRTGVPPASLDVSCVVDRGAIGIANRMLAITFMR